jgi:hypothetical protein
MRVLKSLFILLLVLLLPLAVVAQEEAETPEETSVILGNAGDDGVLVVPYGSEANTATTEQVETLARGLFTLLWNTAYIPFAAPLVMVLTALSKRLPLKISSPTYVFFWTIVTWALYLAATHIGYANQFESVVTSLATLGATFLGLTITPVAAGGLFKYANKHNVALIGTAKTPQAPVYDLTTTAGQMQALADLLKALQQPAPAEVPAPEAQKVPLHEAAPA